MYSGESVGWQWAGSTARQVPVLNKMLLPLLLSTTPVLARDFAGEGGVVEVGGGIGGWKSVAWKNRKHEKKILPAICVNRAVYVGQ